MRMNTKTQVSSTATSSPSIAPLQLPALPPFFSADLSTLAQRWVKWVQSLEYFILASGITDSTQKRAVLLHLVGQQVQDYMYLQHYQTLMRITLQRLNA